MPSKNRIRIALILCLSILMIGTSGYVLIEGCSWLDALYMSVITITTVGFQEVHPLSESGRVFTILLILVGFVSLAFTGHAVVESLLEKVWSNGSERKRMKKRISTLKGHHLICGYGRVGAAAMERLKKAEAEFVIIEANHVQCEEIREKGLVFIEGDATHEHILLEAGIKSAGGLLALLDSDPANLFIVLTARELNPTLHIIARSEDVSSEKKILQAGADRVISPFNAAGKQIADDILSATGMTLMAHKEPNGKNLVEPSFQNRQKVVIVDDNPVILRLYTRLFQKAGFHPLTATSGEEGLDLILLEKPAAAVIDFLLPVLSGIEVCQRIRASEDCRQTKLILFTASDEPDTHRRALHAGADAVIEKSPDASEVIAAVMNALREEPTRSGNQAGTHTPCGVMEPELHG